MPCSSTPSPAPLNAEPATLVGELRNGVRQRARIGSNEINFDFWDAEGSNMETPVVVFLPGFFYQKDRRAISTALGMSAKTAGHAFLTADYFGTGGSDGDFVADGCISKWVADTLAVMDAVVGDRPVVLVGVGIGGWIMIHIAQMRRNVVGLVGQSVTPDFTLNLAEALTEDERKEMADNGFVEKPWGQASYPIGRRFMEDAKNWLVLQGGERSIPVDRPVRLVCGIKDDEYPAADVTKLVEALQSEDVVLSYVKDKGHVLEEAMDFVRLWRGVANVCDSFFEFDLTSPGSG